MLFLFLFVVFVACVAMLWNEGMWSNAITLVNVTLAALIATNYFEPLASFFDSKAPTYTYLFDMLAIWALFAGVYLILRTVTDQISKVRVRFKMPVEHTGRVVFALMAAWVMVGFTAMTIHVAPLGKYPFKGAFYDTPTSSTFLGMAPDRQWIAFVQTLSRGSLRRGYDASNDGDWKYEPHEDDEALNCLVFDSNSELIYKYHTRRASLQEYNEKEGAFRVRRGDDAGD